MSRFPKLFFLDEEVPTEDVPEREEPDKEEDEEDSEMAIWGPEELQFYGPETRTLLLAGTIHEKSSSSFISQLLSLVLKDQQAPISIHLNTPGGNLSDGIAIYDALQAVPNLVVATAIGQCASAGLLILSAANVKLSFANTMFFYHPLQSYQHLISSQEQADSLYEMYKTSLERYNNCIREGFGLNKKNWKKHFEDATSKYFYASEAVEIGIIDEIVQPMQSEKGKTGGKSRKGSTSKR